jgi:hypothetical protein
MVAEWVCAVARMMLSAIRTFQELPKILKIKKQYE